MSDLPERWLPIPNYLSVYEVSSVGRIRSNPRPKTRGGILAMPIGKRGYRAVSLCLRGKQTTHEVHRLVALAFHGARGSGIETRHLDGDELNNCLSNLAYGSSSDNQFDTVRHGTHRNSRKTNCPQGHEYTPENTRMYRGARHCRKCQRAADRAYYQRKTRPDYRSEWTP